MLRSSSVIVGLTLGEAGGVAGSCHGKKDCFKAYRFSGTPAASISLGQTLAAVTRPRTSGAC